MSARERHKEKEKIGILLERERKQMKKGDVRISRKRGKAEGLKRYRGTPLVFFNTGGDICDELSCEQPRPLKL